MNSEEHETLEVLKEILKVIGEIREILTSPPFVVSMVKEVDKTGHTCGGSDFYCNVCERWIS